MIEEYVEMFTSLDRGGRLGKQITILQKQLETVEQKRMKLLTYNAQGKLDDADFLAMNKKCSAEAKELQTQLAEALAQQESTGNMKQQLDTIRSVLRNAQKDAAKGVITKEFVTRYIDKILDVYKRQGSSTGRLSTGGEYTAGSSACNHPFKVFRPSSLVQNPRSNR